MGFKGSSVHTINENGRLSIPSKMRDTLTGAYSDDTLVLVIGKRGFLAGYPVAEWEKYEATLQESPTQTEEEADFLRRLYFSLEEVTLDKQGRIIIPPALRQAAELTGDCIIVGLNNRIEIWDKARWDKSVNTSFDGGSSGMGKQFNQLIL